MTVIGTDQGYLKAPVVLTKFVMCPGERYDVVIDFTGLAPGTIVTLLNDAPRRSRRASRRRSRRRQGAPPVRRRQPQGARHQRHPGGPRPRGAARPDDERARSRTGAERGPRCGDALPAPRPDRRQGLRGRHHGDAEEGNTEVWTFINTTGDAHPIHLHLVKFQIVSRQAFDAARYSAATNFAVPGNSHVHEAPHRPVPQGQDASARSLRGRLEGHRHLLSGRDPHRRGQVGRELEHGAGGADQLRRHGLPASRATRPTSRPLCSPRSWT